MGASRGATRGNVRASQGPIMTLSLAIGILALAAICAIYAACFMAGILKLPYLDEPEPEPEIDSVRAVLAQDCAGAYPGVVALRDAHRRVRAGATSK